MGKAIQTAVVKVLGVLDTSVAKAVNDANKKFTGLKKGVVIAGVALASATTAAAAFGKSCCGTLKKLLRDFQEAHTALNNRKE